jgi:hypothetical protein
VGAEARFRIGCKGSQPKTKAKTQMGDKSPKAKDKAKKQDTAVKNQKKATASNKASAVNALPNPPPPPLVGARTFTAARCSIRSCRRTGLACGHVGNAAAEGRVRRRAAR